MRSKIACKIVLRVMPTKGGLCHRKRKTTKGMTGTRDENVVKKLLKEEGIHSPHQVWVGDIILIKYGAKHEEKCYLATFVNSRTQ